MGEVTELSADALSRRVARGELSCVEVMAAYLDRIEEVNPKLNAIVSLRPRPELMAEAARADDTPRAGWLQGMPIAIKDLAETAGLRTTFGSPLFASHVPAQDALIVARLKAAGAIIIGKTNTPEFGLGSHTTNPVFGPTANPYDLGRTPGGSSGGAAAALAARMLPVADGSDMMGSLRNPAAFCNVYGFRPSWGLVPGEPAGETFFHQLATLGPMGRSPSDIAALLGVMQGADPRLPYAVAADPEIGDLSGDMSGKRIAWLGDWGGAYPCEPGILELCEAAVSRFEALGCEVAHVAPPFEAEALWRAWVTLRAWATACRMKPVYDLPEKRALLNDAMIWEVERGLSLSAQDVHLASQTRSAWFRKLVALAAEYDAFALPSAQVWPFPKEWRHPEGINGRAMDTYHRWMEVVVPVSLIGVPSLAVPAGFGAAGLPMGFQLFGLRGQDRDILRLGQAYHGMQDWTRQAPVI